MNKINEFKPKNEQEKKDKSVILKYMELFPDNILLRSNEIAHITSSGFIMNDSLDKTLFVHHNIRGNWGWTGGHADGDSDLLSVAIKEAKEETGLLKVIPLTSEIASIDILPVLGHYRKGIYVNCHLHLSISYILIANEDEKFTVKPDENSAISWWKVENINNKYFDEHDVYLYNKLINYAKSVRMCI